ncbi:MULTISPECIES: hypothetical protein [Cyanophyceae]|uniref:hypothetical protein n=1 Tax=Cyanophyceae TaxID=3028117 RepID=UPI001684D1B0|nr:MULTISPECIES: hypothetical protein [Cyanophyceae]MBD1917435.1 hypothetical protein [Phormidium sp. FACHB-77]MBD2032320.1 hypothetical protein [Phormidium sp. FACHB-322]MBD2052258.1 hypothetical protein [Leptolyngbya sp. FACHB-60]
MNDAIAPGPGANFSCSDNGEQPTLDGYTRQDFIRDIGHCCTEMVSVATNFKENDDRKALGARLEADTGNGYMLAVRISDDTPPEILAAAADLYEAIQQHYRQSIGEEG